jgi:ATP-dependent Lhr-like helicase
MMSGDIETTRFIRNPLDVAAQQIVATVALEEWPRTALTALLRSSATFGELSDELLVSVLDLLDGRYPSEEFSELRPRIVWERSTDMIRGRAGAQRLAVTNGGTIPDRGLFGVFLPDGARVGELDEEMVYESRVGETFLLGATTWRIEDITFERVVVTPAPGLPGKMPFWHGDGPGRPAELGRALGAFVRELRTMDPVSAAARLRERNLLDELAAANLLAYLEDQQASSGVVPDDRTVVIERFRDEIGDWRVCVLTPFGARVHAPWAMVIRERLEQSGAEDVEIMWTDDGIIFRLPEAMDRLDLSDICVDADVAQETVLSVLPTSAMFASRFREAAARALLLPRRRPDQRTPLWQQRQRAGSLLTVASKYPTFPILLETTRECVNDVFDLPALGEVLESIAQRRTRVVHVDTDVASPMAASLLFSWISVYMYEGDAPLAERRASALALDPDLLRELLGDAELRSLLDPAVIALVEAELQRTAPSHHARDLDEVHDLLRRLGPLTRDGIAERVVEDLDVANAVAVLTQSKRAIEVRVADRQVIADSADAALLRDALGVSLPLGLPASCTEPVLNPLRSLVQRYARSHGPFTVAELVQWCGASPAAANAQLAELAEQRQVVAGEFRPGGRGQEWCEPEVLRQLRRRSLAALRREVEAVESEVLGRFLPTWQGIGSRRSGTDAVLDVVGQLQGAPLVASTLDSDVFGCRVAGYRPGDLDSLVAAGEVVWQGCGSIGAADGRITLAFRSDAALYLQRISQEDPTRPDGPHHEAIRALLAERGASFWTELVAGVAALDLEYEDSVVVGALWDLVWAGEVSNDSFAPLRAWMTGPQKSSSSRAKGRPGHARPGRLRSAGPRSGAGRWSLIAEPDAELTTTERALATARQLLDRYGVLSREMALAEGTTAGFAGVYPALKALEEQGSVRRGYFVAGLGAAQFAIPAAVDLLRRLRGEADQEQATVVVLAATDPAQPYGAVLSWPSSGGKPSRSAGARVVVCNGRAVAWLDRTGKTLLTFSDIAGTGDLAGHDNQGSDAGFAAETWVPALAGLVADGRMHKLEIAKVDGVSVAASPLLPTLRANGFVDSYRGVVLRG